MTLGYLHISNTRSLISRNRFRWFDPLFLEIFLEIWQISSYIWRFTQTEWPTYNNNELCVPYFTLVVQLYRNVLGYCTDIRDRTSHSLQCDCLWVLCLATCGSVHPTVREPADRDGVCCGTQCQFVSAVEFSRSVWFGWFPLLFLGQISASDPLFLVEFLEIFFWLDPLISKRISRNVEIGQTLTRWWGSPS